MVFIVVMKENAVKLSSCQTIPDNRFNDYMMHERQRISVSVKDIL